MILGVMSKGTHTYTSSYPSSKYPLSPSTALRQANIETSVGPSQAAMKMSVGSSQDIIDVDEIEPIASKVEHKQEYKGKH